MPLVEHHHKSAPFIGAVLAGVFTEPALQQLKSLGFTILYIPTASIVKAFAKFGIDAGTDEDTPDAYFQKQVDLYEALSKKRRNSIAEALLKDHPKQVRDFSEALERVLDRQIERVFILPLYGGMIEFFTIEDALASMESFDTSKATCNFVRFEIEVRYNNGNTLRGSFNDKRSAIDFLTTYKPLRLPATTESSRR